MEKTYRLWSPDTIFHEKELGKMCHGSQTYLVTDEMKLLSVGSKEPRGRLERDPTGQREDILSIKNNAFFCLKQINHIRI